MSTIAGYVRSEYERDTDHVTASPGTAATAGRSPAIPATRRGSPEARLSRRRYLVGDHVTEADIRLFTTLARFDPVYQGHFKCNRRKLTEFPALWAYARDLFQTPGFGDTVDFDYIKRHYYLVHTDISPTGVVPRGPDLAVWLTPHGRESLGGSPFGDGSPPAPPEPAEAVPVRHRAA